MKKNTTPITLTRKIYYIGIFLFVILFVLGNLVTYLATKKLATRDSLTAFSLLNPARKFVDPKDLIINIQPLRDELQAIGDGDSRVSIYFEFLNTGANIAVNKDAEFWPASLLKLPVSMAVTKKIERGEWNWNNELVVMASDKDNRFGDLHKQPIGTKISLEKLIQEILQKSDNTANFMLVRNLEPSEFQDVYDHLGLVDFMSKEGKISAKKYSVMFRALYNASYLSETNSQRLLNILSETPFDGYAASAIPDDITFSHKIGVSDERNVFLDSGIVYAEKRPYVLTIMIATKNEDEAKKIMHTVSDRVYKYIVNYQ